MFDEIYIQKCHIAIKTISADHFGWMYGVTEHTSSLLPRRNQRFRWDKTWKLCMSFGGKYNKTKKYSGKYKKLRFFYCVCGILLFRNMYVFLICFKSFKLFSSTEHYFLSEFVYVRCSPGSQSATTLEQDSALWAPYELWQQVWILNGYEWWKCCQK